MAVIPDFKKTTMIDFVKQHIILGSTVYTDSLKTWRLRTSGTWPAPNLSGATCARASPCRAVGGPGHWQHAAVADWHRPHQCPKLPTL